MKATSLGLGPPAPPDVKSGAASQPINALAGPTASLGPANGLSALQASPNPPPQAQVPQIPAPTHQQTVVALRHFNAIERELASLLKDPDIGKSDLKSKIIDGTTKLVAQGILTPAQAVTQLATTPERPYDQKIWVQQHLATVTQAAVATLAHHQAGYLGQVVDTTPPDPDRHLDDVAGLLGKYKGAQNARP